ncbi:hypothetical protein RISK_001299 [Rhodopirellula islandica]|uniref:Uncharacterized protein n=1 Tax=Rhodopirellula islandica TaxID=595434 RepID=A0A0J1ELX0_RHOIS|nr:hypothetical protein RISK_001299 [Rhodopirellula islandica]
MTVVSLGFSTRGFGRYPTRSASRGAATGELGWIEKVKLEIVN